MCSSISSTLFPGFHPRSARAFIIASGRKPFSLRPITSFPFLLSYQEANSISSKRAKGSDYAKCQGLYVESSGFSSWWTRSPFSSNANHVSYVQYDGQFNHISVGNASYGVRPALWINL